MPASGVTAQSIIDQAQIRHPLFSNALAPIGALLKALEARQRSLVLANLDAVDGLVNTTVQITIGSSNVLVGLEDGVPLVGVPGAPGWLEHVDGDAPWVDFDEPPLSAPSSSGLTYDDGWPVHVDDDGVPYANFGEVPIARDPFGAHGGTPGFPLPIDFLKLTIVVAVLGDQTLVPVHVVLEQDRLAPTRHAALTAFLSGNRLVPVRALAANNSGDAWSQDIRALQLSYVALPELADPSARLVLPAALHEAAITWLAEYLAAGTPGLSSSEKMVFSQAARFAEASLANLGFKIAGVASPRSVRYRR